LLKLIIDKINVRTEGTKYHCHSMSLLFCIVSVYAISIYCKCVRANKILFIVYMLLFVYVIERVTLN